MSPQPIIHLPDNLARWPWQRDVNPHYEACKAESAAWLESFGAFRPKAQKAFNLCDFNLLASLAYPKADKARCRTGCDLMNLFFVIDEYTDVVDDREARQICDVVMDALRHPERERPRGECIAGRVTKEFWQLAKKTASPSSQRRFIETFDRYLDCVVTQAADRTQSHIRDVDSYMAVRRHTIGAWPSFALLELDMDLPDHVIHSPEIQELSLAAIDMLILGNDMTSYNVEQARGDDGHNIVTLLMHQYNIGVQAAMDELARIHLNCEERWARTMKALPSWGAAVDAQVARYVDGLGNWVRANDCWSFESQRYFGTHGLRILETRQVQLLPKRAPAPASVPASVPAKGREPWKVAYVLSRNPLVRLSLGVACVSSIFALQFFRFRYH